MSGAGVQAVLCLHVFPGPGLRCLRVATCGHTRHSAPSQTQQLPQEYTELPSYTYTRSRKLSAARRQYRAPLSQQLSEHSCERCCVLVLRLWTQAYISPFNFLSFHIAFLGQWVPVSPVEGGLVVSECLLFTGPVSRVSRPRVSSWPGQWLGLVAQLIKHSTQNSAQPICAAGSITGDLRLIVLMVGHCATMLPPRCLTLSNDVLISSSC